MAKKSSASRKPAQAAMKRKKPARGGKSQMAAPAAVAVTKEQRGHLIEDIAYFHADRYRAVGPGGFREEDRQAAETEIESLLEKKRK
ncbi:MAG: hypothetical protein Q8K18_10705 [Burkholderiales bacterium]|nr:hypothetical protein [Burkholderiales bacterium]